MGPGPGASVPSADPPTIDRDPYERVDTWTETVFSAPYVTVRAHNAVYEDPEFRERVAPAVPAGLDKTPRARFTTGLSFNRPPPGDRTPKRVLPIAGKYARREFRKSLAEDGLRNVREVGSQDLRLPGRRTAKAFGFDGAYPLAESGGGGTLPVRVWAAIWPTADSFAMAGGVYPLESLSLPKGEVEATPGGERREVFAAVRSAAD